MSNVETPVSGGGPRKGAPDGVSASPDAADANVHGRTDGGESGGGAYPNPHAGKEPTGGFMGHGGQTEIDYHGGGQTGEGGDAPNAVTGSDSSDGTESGSAAWPSPQYDPHTVTGDGRSFEIVETNGIAQSEATGKVGTDAPYEQEQRHPGSG